MYAFPEMYAKYFNPRSTTLSNGFIFEQLDAIYLEIEKVSYTVFFWKEYA